MPIFKVPQLAWYGPRDFDISLPDNWKVETSYAEGYNRPALTPEQIRAAIRRPLGQKPLRELARGKKQVAIVFDDMSRVTRVAEIVPFILEELSSAGIAEKNIRFICGVGAHPPITRPEFVKKLGEDVVAHYRCFSHNAFGNCVYVGTTGTHRTRLFLSEEYMNCDLKIVIGACVPHPDAGFGGGAKMIMPGISSFECIMQNHLNMFPDPTPGAKRTKGMGLYDENSFRKDIEDCAGLAGIDFLVNAIVNLWGEAVAIYAGDWRQAYAEAVQDAKSNYGAERFSPQDIIISNAYAKANEASMIGLREATQFLDRDADSGTSIVIIGNAPEGQISHYLLGRWGNLCSPRFVAPAPRYPPQLKQIIFYSEYPHPGSSVWGDEAPVTYLSRWDQVLKALQTIHGDGTRVGIIPDATNQYFPH